MKLLIKEEKSEIDKKMMYFKRNISELKIHLKDIIIEGFDYFKPCDFATIDKFISVGVRDSAVTLINSYEELYKGDSEDFLYYVKEYIIKTFINYFKYEWKNKECDEIE
jgi:hypothetical protein